MTPLFAGVHLFTDTSDKLFESILYKRPIGRLLYINLTTLEISRAVQHLSQFMSRLRKPHCEAVMRILRYTRSNVDKGFYFLVQNDLQLISYCDSYQAACSFSRKYVTSFCVFLDSSLIS